MKQRKSKHKSQQFNLSSSFPQMYLSFTKHFFASKKT